MNIHSVIFFNNSLIIIYNSQWETIQNVRSTTFKIYSLKIKKQTNSKYVQKLFLQNKNK